MMGTSIETTVYRNGSKAVADSTVNGARHRTLYDLDQHTSVTWSVTDKSEGCSGGSFTGDWGDPFQMSAEMAAEMKKNGAKETGSETINGFATKVYVATIPQQGTGKMWVDPKSGLTIKAQLVPNTGAPMTPIEIKKYILGAPAASNFVAPAACAAAAAANRPRKVETMGADFAKATEGPASKDSCSVVFRVVRAGTMAAIPSGFQVAVDPSVDMDHIPHYDFGMGARWTFSGGSLHEVTSQLRNGALRMDGAKATFYVDATFGEKGDASAFVYRQCYGPETVLLLMVKNPEKLSDGAEFVFVKSGKWANAEAR